MTEPATRPAPGSPLPWTLGTGDGCYCVLRYDGGGGPIAYEIDAIEDAVYIAHAANTLPQREADRARLLAMVVVLIDEPTATDRNAARALLAELGEGTDG